MEPPEGVTPLPSSIEHPSGSAALPLYITSTGKSFLNILLTMRHVSAEYWLVEFRQHQRDKRMPDGVIKGKFEVGVDGRAERLLVVADPLVKGKKGWIVFERI